MWEGLFLKIRILVFFLTMLALNNQSHSSRIIEHILDRYGEKIFKYSRQSYKNVFKKACSHDYLVPQKNEKVVIIGAGPSGIHMSALLKESGFSDVTILEKTDRVGGKSLTLYDDDGTPQEMGTCYTIPYKYQELRRIVDQYNLPFKEIPVLPRWCYQGGFTQTSHIEQTEWLLSEVKKKSILYHLDLLASAKLFKDACEYIHKHKRLFNEDSELNAIIYNTQMTFKDYLIKNNLDSLIPMFSLANTVQGYGYIEDVPAIYGLWWNSPEEVLGFVKASLVKGRQPAYILEKGFQVIWEDLQKKTGYPIHFNQDLNITRKNGKIHIKDNNLKIETLADFLIVSSPINSVKISDLSSKETRIVNLLDSTANLAVTLFSVDKIPENFPAIHSWIESIEPKNDGSLMSIRSTSRLLNKKSALNKEFWCGYQYLKKENSMSQNELQEKLMNDLYSVPFVKNPKIISQKVWPYFTRPHNIGAENNNFFDNLIHLHGDQKTWYIGSSVGFESVHDVMERNRFLVDTFISK